MSNFTNAGENLVADYFRGQGLSSLPAAFYVGLASAASDSSITELSGTGYARQAITRSMTNFAGTQASGSTLAGTGTSHVTSNNVSISFGTSGAAWGTANYAVLYDASSGGNALSYHPLATPQVIGSGAPVSLAAGALSCSVSLAGGATDYTVNKFIDLWFRAQAFTWPANAFFALFTAAPTNAGGGTEVNVGNYARVSTPFSLTGFSGTQSAGSTAASSGTSGRISNNFALAYATPDVDWGTITHEGVFDASSAGNLLFWNVLDAAHTVLAGSSPLTHAAGSWYIDVA